MAFRWPTDPPGKAPAHTKSWDAHQASLKGTPAPATALPNPANPLPLIQPPDATYQADLSSAVTDRDQTLAAVRQGRTGGLLDYGYNEDPTSGALSFDVNNPFSRAALLKKNFDTDRAKSAQSMGSGGQLYAGAFQNAQDATFRNQLGAEDSLQKSLINMLARNTQAKTQAGTDFETAAGQAYGDRVGRFQNNPLYDPATGALTSADPASAAQGAASTPAAAAAKPKTKPRGARPKGVGRQSAWSGWYRN